jgi:hypothetical protein
MEGNGWPAHRPSNPLDVRRTAAVSRSFLPTGLQEIQDAGIIDHPVSARASSGPAVLIRTLADGLGGSPDGFAGSDLGLVVDG